MLYPHRSTPSRVRRGASRPSSAASSAIEAVAVLRPRRSYLAAWSRECLSRHHGEALGLTPPTRGVEVVLFTRTASHRVSLSRRSIALERLVERMRLHVDL